LPDDIVMFKYVTGGRFVWTIVKDGRIGDALGGKYILQKDKYTETVEYILGDNMADSVGKSVDFVSKVDGKIWHVVDTIKVNGQDFPIDQKWERCK